MRKVITCSECGQPIRKGNHKPGEYEHAQGCPNRRTKKVERWPVNIPAARGTLRRATTYLVQSRPGCTAPLHWIKGEDGKAARQAIEIMCALDKLLEWAPRSQW